MQLSIFLEPAKKDPTKEVKDLKKAIWYIDRRIKEIENKEGEKN